MFPSILREKRWLADPRYFRYVLVLSRVISLAVDLSCLRDSKDRNHTPHLDLMWYPLPAVLVQDEFP